MKNTLKMAALIAVSAVGLFAVTLVGVSAYIYFKQDPRVIDNALARADTIVVTGRNNDKRVLYRSDDSRDIGAFRKRLKLQKHLEFSIPECRGKLGISLYSGGRRIARLALLPNGHIREDEMKGVNYYTVADPAALNAWLAERNIPVN